jgi:hypothetical protein
MNAVASDQVTLYHVHTTQTRLLIPAKIKQLENEEGMPKAPYMDKIKIVAQKKEDHFIIFVFI